MHKDSMDSLDCHYKRRKLRHYIMLYYARFNIGVLLFVVGYTSRPNVAMKSLHSELDWLDGEPTPGATCANSRQR